MVRIRDVAKRLNLSITTVSRALDGYTDVAEQTRELVVRTAQEMGYTPHRAARQLRRQHAEAIGFILPVETMQFGDPFFSEFISGIGSEIADHNYDLLVSAAIPDSNDELAVYQRWIQSCKVDGMILVRTRIEDPRVEYLLQQKMPFACLERSLGSDASDFVGVEVDSYSGFLQLMDHVTDLGHELIAYIGGCPQLKINHDRFAAYKIGLERANIPFDPGLVMRGDLTLKGGYDAAEQLLNLDTPPTAIVCINDLTAIGAMRAASKRGLVVGRDISIAGYDGLSDSIHSEPPLTTVEQPVYSVARQLARILIAQIKGDELSEKQIKLQPSLRIRASTGVRIAA